MYVCRYTGTVIMVTVSYKWSTKIVAIYMMFNSCVVNDVTKKYLQIT